MRYCVGFLQIQSYIFCDVSCITVIVKQLCGPHVESSYRLELTDKME